MFIHKKIRLQIRGVMPERALLRLRRAGIPLYDIKKPQPELVRFCVSGKDEEKVFAIYPNTGNTVSAYTPYAVSKLPPRGIDRWTQTLKKRWGILLGILLFCMVTLYADGFVFGVEIVGSQVYAREVQTTLDEMGVRPFTQYSATRQDEICAKLLALDGVEFCSVQKAGLWVRVEMRLGSFAKRTIQTGKMRSSHTGEIVDITVLRGSPLKKIGDKVMAGELLVDDDVFTESGGHVRVEIIARVQIACIYEALVCADDAESAFAKAYLEIGADSNTLVEKSIIENKENTYAVRLLYTATQTMNL